MQLTESIKTFSEEYYEDSISFLEELVNINSDSNNISGCNEVIDRIAEGFETLGLNKFEHRDSSGRKYLILSNVSSNEHAYLFLGHADTVFPPDLGFLKFTRKDNRATGPGVIDMKGGIVMLWLGLKILSKLSSISKIPVRILINSDEEIGSYSIRDEIEKLKPLCLGILNFEAARDSGALVIERKGVGVFKLTIKGKAAHSGTHFSQGINAIVELADKILQIHKLTDLDKGITVNPGVISGGTKSNVVPESAELEIDIRVTNTDDQTIVEEKLNEIIRTIYLKGVSIKLEGGFNRSPFSNSGYVNDTFKYFQRSAQDLFDLALSGEKTGGASDINFFNELEVPMLDGIGPCGGNDHTTNEFINLSSIKERAAIFIYALISIDNDRRN